MNPEELKRQIEEKTLGDDLLILQYTGTGKAVCEQYVDAICSFKHKTGEYIESNPLGDLLTNKSVIRVREAKKATMDLLSSSDIVICEEVSPEVVTVHSSSIVVINALEIWQIQDYAKGMLPGLQEEEASWIVNICKRVPLRAFTEIDKISIFDKEAQKSVFYMLNEEDAYVDLGEDDIFVLTNALLRRDLKTIERVLSEIPYADIEPAGFVTIMYNNIRNLMNVKLVPNSFPALFNMTPAQFNVMKRYVTYYTKEQLIKAFDLITQIDMLLKQGKLAYNNIVDYTITHILSY